MLDYISRLENYDAEEIAQVAMDDPYNLYEEAFTIYSKNNMKLEAIEVLLTKMNDIPRALDFADKTNLPEVWTKLGHAYLNTY